MRITKAFLAVVVPQMVCFVELSWVAIGAMALIVAHGASIVTTFRLTAIRITAVAVRMIRLVSRVGTITAEYMGLGEYCFS